MCAWEREIPVFVRKSWFKCVLMSRRKNTNCIYKNLHRFGLTSPQFCRVMFLSPSGATLLIASGRLTSKGNPIIKYLSADVKSAMTINNLWITYLQRWHHTVRVCAKTLCHKSNTAVINSANRMWSSCDKARVEKCQLMTACIDMTLSVN